MITTIIDINNPSNFVINDPTKIDIASLTYARLKLQQSNIDFIENFLSDVGFIYDPTKIEFIGGLIRQIDKRPSNSVFYAKYYTHINANWCNGSETGTAYNGAAISGNLLDLTGGVSQKYVEYNPTNNIPGAQKGCIRIRNYKPDYSGIPSTNQVIYAIGKDLSTKNYISIYHYTNGYIRGTVYDSNGNVLGETLYYWITAIAGNEYEIEFNYDINTGNMYLFVDGLLQGIDTGATGTRTDDITYMFVGRNYNPQTPNFSIGQILIFDEMQHTTNYTPNWSNIYDTIYLESSVILPEMEHIGDGSIQLFNSFSLTYTGIPRILLEIGRSGDNLYWNTSWVISDDTYIQSTEPTIFNTNCNTLPVTGEKYGQFTITFTDSNTLSSVSQLIANLNVDIGYPTTDPYFSFNLANISIRADQLFNFLEDVVKSGDDNVKYVLGRDSEIIYFNTITSLWETSDLTLLKSNSIVEILLGKESFLTEGFGKLLNVYFILHSEDGTTTPEARQITLSTDFVGEEPTIVENTVSGYLQQLDNNISNKVLYVKTFDYVIGTNLITTSDLIPVEIFSNKYFEAKLYIEDVEPSGLIWVFRDKYNYLNEKIIKTNFISGNIKFSDLTIIT